MPLNIENCLDWISCRLLFCSRVETGSLVLWASTYHFHLGYQLTEYPAKACSLRLSLLDLSNNNLSGLPSELGMFPSICFIQ